MTTSLAALRQIVAARMAALGKPNTRQEAWRYVNLREYGAFSPAPAAAINGAAVAATTFSDQARDAVLVVDGRLQRATALPRGWTLAEVPGPDLVGRWQDRLEQADLSELLGLARLDGALRLRAQGVAEPLTIIELVTGGESGWRLALSAAAGAVADVRIIRLHLQSSQSALGLDIEAERDAVLRIDGWEGGAKVGHSHLAAHLHAAAGARIAWSVATAGGVLSRHLAYAHLDGERSAIELAGTARIRGKNQHHHVVRVFHHAGNSTSRQDFRTVAEDDSVASFDGIIHVDKGADGTDAYQNSANLQLGAKARIAARPQLDIHADEVKASHGATVGQPDADEVRYLTSRGISAVAARDLIIQGFLETGVQHLADSYLQELARGLLGQATAR